MNFAQLTDEKDSPVFVNPTQVLWFYKAQGQRLTTILFTGDSGVGVKEDAQTVRRIFSEVGCERDGP
jgi:hypothetical protein